MSVFPGFALSLHPDVFGWSHPLLSFEKTREMLWIFETEPVSGFRYVMPGGKKIFPLLHNKPLDIFACVYAGGSSHKLTEIAW